MDTFEAIRTRRAVKWYDPNHRLTPEQEEQIFDLAKEAPSSVNAQHWRVVNVKDAEIRKQIRAAAVDQAQVTDASLLLVICADTKAWKKDPVRYVRNAPKDVQDLYIWFGKEFYEGKHQLERDEALRSASFLALTMMLTATAMGLETCPMIGFDPDKVAEIIKLPEDHFITMLLAIGKGTKKPWPKAGYIDRSEWLFEDHF
jgi:nitroreductase